ncbi:protein-tyrosine phosphatase family protein [Maritimibacter fusiformis]|uniref:Protein phosphatase n=1 Tax=Maritimibacter fusiformis TaxID=2603819 RepID=A0A5D0RMJ8_9RHOB|nr:protein-tyrosine phosphatase family protein [Maritimibacter fusiformis]TYB82065.1 protein phosphatase [Maritimibacter fusiformis]
MAGFQITELTLAAGVVGLCPIPGGGSFYSGDVAAALGWRPDVVLVLSEDAELHGPYLSDLSRRGIGHVHLPVPDMGAPGAAFMAEWDDVSDRLHRVLEAGGRVLVQCYAGCGRSGAVALRLMIEAGEAPYPALNRLRAARPCAVETDAQFRWACEAAPR